MCTMAHFTHILPQPILQKMIEVVLKLLLPVVHVFREGRGLKYQYSVIPKSGAAIILSIPG
jgi:hypothetical protein